MKRILDNSDEFLFIVFVSFGSSRIYNGGKDGSTIRYSLEESCIYFKILNSGLINKFYLQIKNIHDKNKLFCEIMLSHSLFIFCRLRNSTEGTIN